MKTKQVAEHIMRGMQETFTDETIRFQAGHLCETIYDLTSGLREDDSEWCDCHDNEWKCDGHRSIEAIDCLISEIGDLACAKEEQQVEREVP